MKIEKSELAKRIGELKSVVPKSSPKPALMGILVQGNCLIASNGETTVKAILDTTQGETFIIPSKAFDLIKSLPDGEVSVTADNKHLVTIKIGKIKNTYQSFPAEDFPYTAEHISEGGGETKIQAKELKEAMSHVLYAIPDKSVSAIMSAMCLQAGDGKLNFVGLDGHVLAWDQKEFDGEFELLIPKIAAEKVLSLDMVDEVAIEFDGFSAMFKTKKYEVYTRLIEGQYFKYKQMFNDLPNVTEVRREDLLNAIIRAKLCTDELTPTKFELEGESLTLSIKDRTADYSETIQLLRPAEKLTIGFNSRLVLETLKAFCSDDVLVKFGSSVQPMILSAEGGNMKAVILPVRLGG